MNGTTASFPNATAVTFPNANPTVKAKSAAAVLGNTTQLATEAQVALAQNTAGTALNAFRDSVYTKAQTLGGDKTFSGTNTFTVSPTVPSKSAAAGNNATTLATESQVYAVATAGSTALATLNAFRDSVYTKAQTLAGNKTLSGNTSVGGTLGVTGATTLTGNLTANGTTASFPNATAVTFPNANPTVKAKSAAAVLGNATQLATEAQVALAQNTAGNTLNLFRDSVYTKAQTLAGIKTFSAAPLVPSKATAAGNNPTYVATEAQVNLKANLAGATFTGAIAVPNKTAAASSNGTLVATEAQVYAVAAAGSSGLNAFRDSVYTKAQTLAGNKTLSGNTSVGGTLGVTGATTLSNTLAVTGATTLSGNLTANGTTASFPNATAVTFPNANPTVKAKSTAAALANTTQLATEAQVALAQNTAGNTLNLFRDSVYTKAQTLAGVKTFSAAPVVPNKTVGAGTSGTAVATEAQVNLKANLAGATFTGAVSVPTKTTAATSSGTLVATEAQVALKANLASPTFTGTVTVPTKTTGATNNGTLVATEAQVYAVAAAGSSGLSAFRDSVYTKAQTLAGIKTFSAAPVVPNKTVGAGTSGTAVATEAQVNLKANLAGATFTGAVSVPTKTTAATSSGTLVATEAQVNLKANLSGATFTGAVSVPTKTTAATSSGTLVATEAQVALAQNTAGNTLNLFRDSVYTKAQTLAGVKTFSAAPLVPSKATAAGNNPTYVATEAQVNLKANLAGATFTGAVSVPTKTTAATSSGTLVATEAQVNLKANLASPTFTGTVTVPNKTAAATDNGTLVATEAQVALKANLASPTFTGTVSVPSKSSAAGANATLVATEAQVYAVATAGNTALSAFRDSVYTKTQTLAGVKTFSAAPVVPNKTVGAGAIGTAVATEYQVNLKANLAGATFTGAIAVPNKTAAAISSNGTLVATEAQVALKANINSPVFTGIVTVPAKTTAAQNNPTYVATEAQVFNKADKESPAFTGVPTVTNKTSAASNDGTLFATEAQVYAVAHADNPALNAFRDSVYTKNQFIGGEKTFTGTVTMPVPRLPASTLAKTFFAAPTATAGTPIFRQIVAADLPTVEKAIKLAIGTDSMSLANLNTFKSTTESGAQSLGGVKTFTSAPVVPSKSAAIAASNGTTATAVATEAQVFLTAQAQAKAVDPSKLQTFRDSVYNGAMTLAGVKSFTSAPLVPAKTNALTAATGTTALATEAQVYNTVLNTNPAALIAHIDSIYNRNMSLGGIKTFSLAPVVPAKSNSGNSNTAIATDAAVNAVRDSLLTKTQELGGNKTFSNDVTVTGTTTLNGASTLAGTTTVSGAASFTSTTATQFTTSPTVPEKTAAITVGTGITTLATEAQVFNSVKNLTNGLRDSVYSKPMSLSGLKTFTNGITTGTSSTNTINGTTTIGGTATFSTAPQVPSKSNAIAVADGTGATVPATEAQVYATVQGATSTSLAAFRDSVLTKAQTLNGEKTFGSVPTLPSQTQGFVFAAPTASDGTPIFRALVATDVPVLNQNTTGTAAKATMLATGADSTKLADIATGATKNVLATALPLIAGTAVVGTPAAGYAAGDHVHPTQVQNNLTTASTTLAPSVAAVSAALADKLDKLETLALTGDVTAPATELITGTIATTLANTGVSAGSYGPTAAQSPVWGGTFSVPSFTVDAKGRLTYATSHTVTLPSAVATSSNNGLMSANHFNMLNRKRFLQRRMPRTELRHIVQLLPVIFRR